MTFSFRASSYQASSYSASSRMTSEFIYSSCSDSSTYFILKQSSSSLTNSSKFVFFAFAFISFFIMIYTNYTDSSVEVIIQKSTLTKRISRLKFRSISIDSSAQVFFQRFEFIHDNTYELRQIFFDQIQWSHQFFSAKHCILAEFRVKHDESHKFCCHICDIIISIEDIKNEYSIERHISLSDVFCQWLNYNKQEIMIIIQAKHDEEARIEKKRVDRVKQQQIEQTRIDKKRAKAFACRRCNAKFSSNTKFHHHIENHHTKKSTKFANEFAATTSIATFASITFFFTSKAMIAKRTFIASIANSTFFATFSSTSESALMLTSSISQSKSIIDISFSDISFATSIATSKKIFWVEIVSRSIMTSKSSRFSIFTSKRVSIIAKTASNICSSTSQTSNSKHQKSYFTIENLFEMFVEKRTKSDLLHIKKIEFSSKVSHQVKITFYFKSVANQNKSISQSSKTSNSKNFQQRTLAKSNRIKFNDLNKWFEKTIILSYKSSTLSRLFISKTSSVSSYKILSISGRSVCTFLSRNDLHSSTQVSFDIFVFSHVCRICSDIFESNNDLHRHLRVIHFDHASRHESEKHALERNIMTWKFLIFWRRNRSFSYFFSCITNRILEERLACSRHSTQRKRCDLLSLMTFVTINLHIELKSKYFDKNELASWQSDSISALCFLDSNNKTTLFITLLFKHICSNKVWLNICILLSR